MKKIIIGAGLVGSGMITGGFGLLVANGYDVLNPEVWSISSYLVRTDPMKLLSASFEGSDRPLFTGLSFIYGGLSVIAVGLATTSVITLVSSLRSPVKKAAPKQAEAKKQAPAKVKRTFKMPDFSGAIDGIKMRFESDKEVDLDAEVGGGKFIDIPEPEIEKPAPKPVQKPAASVGANRIKFKRSFKEEAQDFIAGLKDRFGLAGSDEKEEKLRFGVTGTATKQADYGRLSQWYVDAQSGASDQDELVSTAREICDEWSDADFAEFASLDPLNGAFIVRLVRSWADRVDDDADDDMPSDGGHNDEKRRDKEAMRAAFRAIKSGADLGGEDEDIVDLDEDDEVINNKAEADTDGEDYVDLDSEEGGESLEDMFAAAARKVEAEEGSERAKDATEDDVASEEESNIEDDLAAAARAVEQAEGVDADEGVSTDSVMEELTSNTEGDDAADAEDNDVAAGPESLEELAEILSEMRGFASLCQAAINGEEEWPEDWADDQGRMEHALALSSALEEQEYAFEDGLANVVRDNADEHEEFEWTLENASILTDGYVEFIKSILNPADPDAEDEGQETLIADDDGTEVPDSISDMPTDDEAALADESSVADEVSSDDEDSFTIDTDMEEDGEGVTTTFDNEGRQDGLVSEFPGHETESEDGELIDAEDHSEEEIESEVVVTDEPASVLAPKDVSISPIAEIEVAGSLPYEWGRHCKMAGANDGTVAKMIFAKEGKSFRTLGMAHVVMIWKKGDASDRMNVILKKLPAGEWSCKMDGSLRMENSEGHFVEVPQELLEHPEVREHKTVVHFYGDGIGKIEDIRVGENLLAVSKVMSEQEISEFMGK